MDGDVRFSKIAQWVLSGWTKPSGDKHLLANQNDAAIPLETAIKASFEVVGGWLATNHVVRAFWVSVS